MSSRVRLYVATGVFLALLVAAGIYLRSVSVRPVHALPRLGQFPAFSLPDASGRIWRNSDLRGVIWISSAIPPSCASCAIVTLKMTDLQTSLEKARDVRLVSFVSDPALSGPGRLSELAREFGAENGRWAFLSGPAGPISRARVFLVDPHGEIRGNFDATSPEFSSDVLDAVGDLMREKRR